MKEHQLDICGAHWEKIDANGRVIALHRAPLTQDELIATLATTVPYAHGVIMMRKKFLELNKLRYSLGYGEDYRLWVECFEHQAKFGAVDQVLYRHREHNTSITFMKMREQAYVSKKIRKNFVRGSLVTCEAALNALKPRFQNLARLMQVHILYLAFQVKLMHGKSSFFFFFFKAPLRVKLHFMVRAFRA